MAKESVISESESHYISEVSLSSEESRRQDQLVEVFNAVLDDAKLDTTAELSLLLTMLNRAGAQLAADLRSKLEAPAEEAVKGAKYSILMTLMSRWEIDQMQFAIDTADVNAKGVHDHVKRTEVKNPEVIAALKTLAES